MSTEAMGLALAAFARDEGIGPGRRAVLALDRAGRHVSPALALPAGIHLAFLPPYSPEPQPAERLQGLVDEPIATRALVGLDALETALVEWCRTLAPYRRTVKVHTRFDWRPRDRYPRKRR